MSATPAQPALPFRSHTILGVCEGIGEDFGFNPTFLRVPLAAIMLFSPMLALVAYVALALIVLASRLIFPANAVAVQAEGERVSDAALADASADEEMRLAA